MGIYPFITAISQFRVKNLPTSGVTGMDQANAAFYGLIHGIVYDSKIDFAEVLWNEFKNASMKIGYNQISCPRFLSHPQTWFIIRNWRKHLEADVTSYNIMTI